MYSALKCLNSLTALVRCIFSAVQILMCEMFKFIESQECVTVNESKIIPSHFERNKLAPRNTNFVSAEGPRDETSAKLPKV